ncbi:MAG: LysR substrate-binding domain-containing protein [Planctomycetota bacterium]|nr:LysR substrate-binding domain-containing protein [Planctomycetota bacterium]
MAPVDVTAITLAELRYVVALAEHRHFGRAAASCHITQPTLSAALKKVETTLRVKLFERSPKGVAPTATGAEVAEAARAVLDAMQRIVDLAGRGREPLSGTLRLGMIPTLGPYLLPRVAPLLAREFPKLSLVFRELKTSDMVDEIAHHQLDAGILALPVPPGPFAVAPIFEEPFLLVAPAQHPLAARKSVTEAELEGERVLLLDEGHCLRDQALSICRASGAAPSEGVDFRATSIETLRHMVAAGMGVTLLPRLALADDEEARSRVVVRPFAGRAPGRRMAIVWRKTHPRGADHERLAAFLRAHLPVGVSPLGKTPSSRP